MKDPEISSWQKEGEKNTMENWTSGMAWSDIAVSAYRAYAASTGNKNYQGLPMPAWENLTRPIQIAWEAAVRQTGECIGLLGDTRPPDEQRWAGWAPPQLPPYKE